LYYRLHQKNSNKFKGPANRLVGVALEFDSQGSRCRGRPKLQLGVRTIKRYERRCDELKIAVAIAKEERDKLVMVVEEERHGKEKAKEEALRTADLNLRLKALLALSEQALKLSKQSLQSAIHSQCNSETSAATAIREQVAAEAKLTCVYE
jgi:hypothetical protein